MMQNIVNVFNMATPEEVEQGITWYAEAQCHAGRIAKEHDLPLHIVVGVIAALSPNNKWARNISNAEDLIFAFMEGDTIESVSVSTYNKMKEKAWKILEEMPNDKEVLALLSGQKIMSFHRCIMGYKDACCIDGHARNIAYGERVPLSDNRTNIRSAEYERLAKMYAEAAEFVSSTGRVYHAYEVQAITWVTWRRIHEIF